jgi:hypothetical protein
MAPQWYDERGDNSPWIKALAELHQRATREGFLVHHTLSDAQTTHRPSLNGGCGLPKTDRPVRAHFMILDYGRPILGVIT